MILLRLLKSCLRKWLEERALVIPASRRAEWAYKLGVPVEVVMEIEDKIRLWVLSEVDRL